MPNADPEILERAATSPLENVLAQIDGLEKIYSLSREGAGSIDLTFKKHVDLEYKRFEVYSNIRRIYSKLDPRLSFPVVGHNSEAKTRRSFAYSFYVASNNSLNEIDSIVSEKMLTTLLRTKNVADVQLSGAKGKTLILKYNIDKLKAHGITVSQLFDQLQLWTNAENFGSITFFGQNMYFVRLEKEITAINDFARVRIKAGEKSLPLKDLVEIKISDNEASQYFKVDGMNAIIVNVYVNQNANMLSVVSALNDVLESVQNELPNGYVIYKGYDGTKALIEDLKDIRELSVLVFLLAIAVIALRYRNWKSSLTVLSAYILTVCLTTLAILIFKLPVHYYTIAGGLVATGVSLMNVILTLDSIEGSATPTRKVIFTTFIGYCLLIVSFSMCFTLDQLSIRYKHFAISAVVAFSCSFVVTCLYTKFNIWHKAQDLPLPKKRSRLSVLYQRIFDLLGRLHKIAIAILTIGFGIPIYLLPEKIEGFKWYNNTIGSQVYQQDIHPYVEKALGGALRYFMFNAREAANYSPEDKTQLIIEAAFPLGTTVEQVQTAVRTLERRLIPINGIEMFMTSVFPDHAVCQILFRPEFDHTSLAFDLKGALIEYTSRAAGISWSIYGAGRGFSTGETELLPSFQIELRGYNLSEVERQCNLLAARLKLHNRVQNVNTNERLYELDEITQYLDLRFGDSSTHFGRSATRRISNSIRERSGQNVFGGHVILNGAPQPFALRSHSPITLQDLMEIAVYDHGATLRVKDISTPELRKSLAEIRRENRQYIRIVGVDYQGTYGFGQRFIDEVIKEQRSSLPNGYSIKRVVHNAYVSQKEKSLAVILMHFVALFSVCALYFNCARKALVSIIHGGTSLIGVFLVFGFLRIPVNADAILIICTLPALFSFVSVVAIDSLREGRPPSFRSISKNRVRGIKGLLCFLIIASMGLAVFMATGIAKPRSGDLIAGALGGVVIGLITSSTLLPVLVQRWAFLQKKVAGNAN